MYNLHILASNPKKLLFFRADVRYKKSIFWFIFEQLLSNYMRNYGKRLRKSRAAYGKLYVKHKKLLFLAVLTWFLILDKIQDRNPNKKKVHKLLSKSYFRSDFSTNLEHGKFPTLTGGKRPGKRNYF